MRVRVRVKVRARARAGARAGAGAGLGLGPGHLVAHADAGVEVAVQRDAEGADAALGPPDLRLAEGAEPLWSMGNGQWAMGCGLGNGQWAMV